MAYESRYSELAIKQMRGRLLTHMTGPHGAVFGKAYDYLACDRAANHLMPLCDAALMLGKIDELEQGMAHLW